MSLRGAVAAYAPELSSLLERRHSVVQRRNKRKEKEKETLKMATNSTLSPEYLAESKTGLVTTMYAIPIALEALSTGWRLWASASAQSGFWFSFDDYLMLFATVWLQDAV